MEKIKQAFAAGKEQLIKSTKRVSKGAVRITNDVKAKIDIEDIKDKFNADTIKHRVGIDNIRDKLNIDSIKRKTVSQERLNGETAGANEKVSTVASKRGSKKLSKKQMRAKNKAEYLASLPKSRIKRFFYRLHPKRSFSYWFSKEGAKSALKIGGIALILFAVVSMATFAFFRGQLPDPREVNSRQLSQTTVFYDRTGETQLFEYYGDENRKVVEFDEISDYMKWATVAVEDRDFYKHGGFSLVGITRAAINNAISDNGTQGGSTITQQFVKNSLLTDERTITRKIKELILSIELERLYTKDEILSFYLNEIPYGSLEYGVEAAAKSFFGKNAIDLNIAESAMLAALPQAPSYYSPYGNNTDDLIARQHTIIDMMREQGYITDEAAQEAKDYDILANLTPIEEKSLYKDVIAPHFINEVQNQLIEEFGKDLVQTGGLKVITTLDLELQKIAEKAVKENMDAVLNPTGGGGGDNAAIVAGDNDTGQILAMVGSRNFNHPKYGSYNAAMADRQPGSSFKPFGYAELFKSDRWGPDSFIYDTDTTFGDYNPDNFDFRFKGQMTVREALGESRNIPAVKALYIAGVDNVIDLARAMGNKTIKDDPGLYGLSLVLGAGEVKLTEHVNAYSSFARGGVYKPQSMVLKVENSDGEVLQEWEETEGDQVLDPQIAYLMTDALKDDAARSGTFGLGNPRLVVPGIEHTVKTGTTDGSVDGWMMGYTRQITVGVWAGNHDNTPMDSITSWQTGPIFTQFLREAYDKKDYERKPIFDEVPSGIQRITMDAKTGWAATDATKDTYVGLFPSWHQKQLPGDLNKFTVDTVSGGLATECTPEAAKKEQVATGLWPELLPDDPAFPIWAKSAGYGNVVAKPDKTDNVHDCDDVKPSVSISTSDEGGGVYRFTANVTEGTHDLDKLYFKVDGQIVSSYNINKSDSYSYEHSFSSTGSKRITAEVIDDVLYSAEDSKTINVSQAASSSISLTSPSSGSTESGSVKFEWTTDSAANQYEVCWRKTSGGGTNCESTSNTSYTAGPGEFSGDGEYEAWVKSFDDGDKLRESAKVNFTLS